MLTKNAITVLERRYLRKDEQGNPIETPEGMFHRVANAVAAAERLYGKSDDEVREIEAEFYRMMSELEFLPNSPTLMNAGRKLGQLAACFVLPIEDTMESIFETIKHTALIHKSGGGTGFSFSRLRPAKDVVQSTNGVSSGPISFMEVFNAATEAIKQGGTRRGANMGCLRVDHPDILDFITAKKDNNRLTNFNISVLVTEQFMEAVEKNQDYDLINPRTGQKTKSLNARKVFDLIVNMAWRNGEPGIIFIDRINRDNPTPKLGEIESTNPCGEQPLLPYEACNLGSINLSKFVANSGGEPAVDYMRLGKAVRMAVRFLDDVIDVSKYPLVQIDKMVKGNRKIGLGVMGFADMLIMLGIPYDSEQAITLAEEVMSFIQTEARQMSAELAAERGAFPNFEGSIYDVPEGTRMRNATVTTIAPTGTLSIIAGCSSGIEPLFAVAYIRTVLDGTQLVEVNPLFEKIARERGFYSDALMKEIAVRGTVKGIAEVPTEVQRIFVTAHDIAPVWHVKMQAAFQKYVDNAVSKTVNFPNSATTEDVAEVFKLAYRLGCKGVTVYRDGSREEQVLSVGTSKKESTSNSETGVLQPRPRPVRTFGVTEKVKTGCGNLYVTINEDSEGLCEVFARMGKSGGCASSQLDAVSRVISAALRAGVKPESIIKQLRGNVCPSPAWDQGGRVLSCPDAIGIALEHYLQYKQTGEPVETVSKWQSPLDNLVGACPDCGSAVEHESGCIVCRFCGFSKCG
ncbi:MAG: vitamin B12-dependent ribonucleotide reductase [Armatimonadota bacterium]|nr:vitamin B12-dependent ribonucleotide reductase [Armatimonadota bacterium]